MAEGRRSVKDPFAPISPVQLRGAFEDIIRVGMIRAGCPDHLRAPELARRVVNWMERQGMRIHLQQLGSTRRPGDGPPGA
jgi:hypothetical protein